mgnify:CR=1 FL=1
MLALMKRMVVFEIVYFFTVDKGKVESSRKSTTNTMIFFEKRSLKIELSFYIGCIFWYNKIGNIYSTESKKDLFSEQFKIKMNLLVPVDQSWKPE